jgi:phospholipid/cholesterol/gamma-HCH transport system substrate-binding protein
VKALVVALLLVAFTGGCSGAPPGYRVTVRFADVLDLAPRSAVRVDDVVAGRVESIRLRGFTAEAVLLVDPGVRLPGNAVAEIRQASVLGSKYVALGSAPGTAPSGRLRDGDVIPLARTSHGAEVEEVLSALSLLITGGGMEQVQTITHELTEALGGREDQLRNTLAQLDTFARTADAQKTQILGAITSIDRLTTALARQRATLAAAAQSLEPGLRVLAEQRAQLEAMADAVARLGAAGAKVVTASSAAILADLRSLQPILGQLSAAGTSLPKALELLASYPFPSAAGQAIAGGALGVDARAQLDLPAAPTAPRPAPSLAPKPTPAPAPAPAPAKTPGPTKSPVPSPSAPSDLGGILPPGTGE